MSPGDYVALVKRDTEVSSSVRSYLENIDLKRFDKAVAVEKIVQQLEVQMNRSRQWLDGKVGD